MTKDQAIILCGHGSRNSIHVKDFLDLKNKLKEKVKDIDLYHCFIEINEPSIEICIKENIKHYKKLYFFPLLLFEGKHLVEDINRKVKKISEKENARILIINKLSLINDILPMFINIIKKFHSNGYDFFITSCSYSKKDKVIDELKSYTEKLSKKLKIKKKIFHFVGDEKNVLSKIDNFKKEPRILLHPVFFFDGFLYKKNIEKLSSINRLDKLWPISHYEDIITLISKKLIQGLNTLN